MNPWCGVFPLRVTHPRTNLSPGFGFGEHERWLPARFVFGFDGFQLVLALLQQCSFSSGSQPELHLFLAVFPSTFCRGSFSHGTQAPFYFLAASILLHVCNRLICAEPALFPFLACQQGSPRSSRHGLWDLLTNFRSACNRCWLLAAVSRAGLCGCVFLYLGGKSTLAFQNSPHAAQALRALSRRREELVAGRLAIRVAVFRIFPF